MADKINDECGDCKFLRDCDNDNYLFAGSSNEKGHCIMLGAYFYPDDRVCTQFEDKNASSCYLTTIVCDLLGYDDKCPILETMRDFRNNVMQKNEQYKEVLCEYDTVGPRIAKELEIDRDYELVNGMLDCYILPVVDLIRTKQYDQAVNIYKNMTKSLEDYYGIDYNITVPTDYDYENGGHGTVKCLKLGEKPL